MISLLTKYYLGEEIEEKEWAGLMSCTDQKKISMKVCLEKACRKEATLKLYATEKNDIKMYKKQGWELVDRFRLPLERDKYLSAVNTITKLWVTCKRESS
jgi:hypothetical protein